MIRPPPDATSDLSLSAQLAIIEPINRFDRGGTQPVFIGDCDAVVQDYLAVVGQSAICRECFVENRPSHSMEGHGR